MSFTALPFSAPTLAEIEKLYHKRGHVELTIGIDRETGTAVAVAVNYGLVNAEQIGFSILRNDDK